jgi:hypothetical protein
MSPHRVFLLSFQADYGHAYGSRARDSNAESNGAADAGELQEDTKLKALIKEIKASVEEAKGFWTKLPYGMCQDEAVGSKR